MAYQVDQGHIDKEACSKGEDPLVGLRTVKTYTGPDDVANEGHQVHVGNEGKHSPHKATLHTEQDAVVTWETVVMVHVHVWEVRVCTVVIIKMSVYM